MSQTLRLLKYDPSVALLIMANNHYNINLRPEYARAVNPTALGETLTEVTIETFDSIDSFIYRRCVGTMRYRYNRIRVSDVFTDLVLDITPPATIGGMMNNLALASGLIITDDDFENGLIEGDSFVLKAKPGSLRWVGETTVMLNEPAEYESLADAFPNNVLNGLYPPSFTQPTPLSEVIVNKRLDGLTFEAQ